MHETRISPVMWQQPSEATFRTLGEKVDGNVMTIEFRTEDRVTIGGTEMKRLIAMTFWGLLLLLAGCASGDGGQALSGVLMGIGQGLSGL